MSQQESSELKPFSNSKMSSNLNSEPISQTGSSIIEKPILAVDYGTKRVGLAVSDVKGLFASPLSVIQVTRNKTEEMVIDEIEAVAEKYRVKTLLIGLPQAFVEGHNVVREKIIQFAELISSKSKLRTAFYDESFSTKGAENMLLSLGQSRKKYKDKIDSLAAANFLKEYLDAEQRLQTQQPTDSATGD